MTVDVRRCPDDVTLQANSPLRRRAVHWPAPEFIGRDGAMLESSCTKDSGAEFAVGSTKVDCFPDGMSSAGCSFRVNVVGTAQKFSSTFRAQTGRAEYLLGIGFRTAIQFTRRGVVA